MEEGQTLETDFNTPVNRFFGYTLCERTPTSARVSMSIREDYLQGEGAVQGGIISALADAAAVAMLVPGLRLGMAMTGVEFKLNFLQPTLLGRGDPIAHAQTVRTGRTIAVCEVEVRQGDNLIAKGLFTYLFFERR